MKGSPRYICGCDLTENLVNAPIRCKDHHQLIDLGRLPIDKKNYIYLKARKADEDVKGKRIPQSGVMRDLIDILYLAYYWDVFETKACIIEVFNRHFEAYIQAKERCMAKFKEDSPTGCYQKKVKDALTHVSSNGSKTHGQSGKPNSCR